MVGAMALAIAMFGEVALAAEVVCSTDPCEGTPENDAIIGTDAGEETIKALDGDDFVDGRGGNDKVLAVTAKTSSDRQKTATRLTGETGPTPST